MSTDTDEDPEGRENASSQASGPHVDLTPSELAAIRLSPPFGDPLVRFRVERIVTLRMAQAWDEGVTVADEAAGDCCGCNLAPKVGPNPYRDEEVSP